MDLEAIDAAQIRNKLGVHNKIHADEFTAEKLIDWCVSRKEYKYWKKEAIGKYAIGVFWVSEAQIRAYIQSGKCLIYDTTHNTNRSERALFYCSIHLMPFQT